MNYCFYDKKMFGMGAAKRTLFIKLQETTLIFKQLVMVYKVFPCYDFLLCLNAILKNIINFTINSIIV